MHETSPSHLPVPPIASPLGNLQVVEAVGTMDFDLVRSAVSFAGLLAAKFGAKVFRADGPTQPDTARHRFLNQGKMPPDQPIASGAFLLTDDPARVAAWPSAATTLVRAARGTDVRHSELTILGESGLLDIFGTAGAAPLPLPGRQTAYAAGMAAFNALVASYYATCQGKAPVPADVSILDVALWVNWKHYLAAQYGDANPGIGRAEEWTTVACADGYMTLVFQDQDMPRLARLTGNALFERPEMASRATRKPLIPTIHAAIESWMAPQTRAAIAAQAQSARIPIGPVLEISELIDDAQFGHRGFLDSSDGVVRPRLPLLWNGRRIGPMGLQP